MFAWRRQEDEPPVPPLVLPTREGGTHASRGRDTFFYAFETVR